MARSLGDGEQPGRAPARPPGPAGRGAARPAAASPARCPPPAPRSPSGQPHRVGQQDRGVPVVQRPQACLRPGPHRGASRQATRRPTAPRVLLTWSATGIERATPPATAGVDVRFVGTRSRPATASITRSTSSGCCSAAGPAGPPRRLADADRVEQLAGVVVAVPGADALRASSAATWRGRMPDTVNASVGVVRSGRPSTCTCGIARRASSSQPNSSPSYRSPRPWSGAAGRGGSRGFAAQPGQVVDGGGHPGEQLEGGAPGREAVGDPSGSPHQLVGFELAEQLRVAPTTAPRAGRTTWTPTGPRSPRPGRRGPGTCAGRRARRRRRPSPPPRAPGAGSRRPRGRCRWRCSPR